MQLSPETIMILGKLPVSEAEKLELFRALERDWLAFQPPAALNGTTEERERLRNEDTKAERKRAADRQRMAAKREAERVARLSHVSLATVPSVACDSRATVACDTRDQAGDCRATPPEPRARVGDNLPRLVTSDAAVAVVVSSEPEDWPKPGKRGFVALIVEAVGSPWLDPAKSQSLILTAGRIEAWRKAGASWEHDVLPVVRALCARRRSAISSWRFFDDAIAQSIVDNRAALAMPEAGKIVPFRATGPPRTIDERVSAAWDYAIEKIAQDEQSEN